MSVSTALAIGGFAMSAASGIAGTHAGRMSARAEMKALENERWWNLGVMEQNLVDTRERSLLSSYESGIDPMTGSNFAIIEENARVMRDEMNFMNKQYLTKIGNARAQSKQQFLGLF